MTPRSDSKIGAFIRRHREAAGLTMAALAQEAGVQRSQVLRIERGDIQPGPGTLARLAGPLKVAVEDLYATAGYSAGLPGFETYLREKYGMSDAAVAEAEAFFHDLQQRDTGGRRGKRRR